MFLRHVRELLPDYKVSRPRSHCSDSPTSNVEELVANILRHADPSLGNDRKRSSYTTTVTE
jgi:hypothetical protein